jgi:hypothetical protein
MRSSSQFKVPQPIKKRKHNVIVPVLADVFDHEHSLTLKIINDLTIIDFTNLVLTCKRLHLLVTKEQYFKYLLNRAAKYFIGHLNRIDPKIIPFLIKRRGVIAGGSVLRVITMIPLDVYGDSNIDIFLSIGDIFQLFRVYIERDGDTWSNIYYLKISDNRANEDGWRLEDFIDDIPLVNPDSLRIVRRCLRCKNDKTGDIIQLFIVHDIIASEPAERLIRFISTIGGIPTEHRGNEIIKWFDQSCCQCYFDGRTIYSMNIESQVRMISKYLRSVSIPGERIPDDHQKRIEKYRARGFKINV